MNLKNIPSLAYNLPQDVLCLKYNGDFEQEIELIDALLKRSLPQPLVERLQMEKLLAEGMMKDYETSFDEALAKFQTNIEGFTAEELKSYMVQGVIDCAFLEGDEWVLVDYKTDRVEDTKAFTDEYRPQLKWYAEAIRDLTGKPVKETWLYSLSRGEAYPV